MGHHWRERRPTPPKPSWLAEFLGLFLSVFRPEGLNGMWLPFDPSPRSFPTKKTPDYES